MTIEELQSLVLEAIEDLKGKDVVCLDVSNLSSLMERVVVATGTSTRHAKSIANSVVMAAKESGLQPLGVEGMQNGEWVLVDLGDIVVHVMQEQMRDFYQIERLWAQEDFAGEEEF